MLMTQGFVTVFLIAFIITFIFAFLMGWFDHNDKQKQNKNVPQPVFASKSDTYINLLKEGETYLLGDVSFRFHKLASPVVMNATDKVVNSLPLLKGIAITLSCTSQNSSASKDFEMNVGVDYTHFDFEGKKYRISVEKPSNVFVLEFVQDLK